MKKPNLKNLVYDPIGTKKIREMAKKTKKIKITLFIDEDSLITLKKKAEKIGAKYQTLINKILHDSLSSIKDNTDARLNKIEKELEELKSLIKKTA